MANLSTVIKDMEKDIGEDMEEAGAKVREEQSVDASMAKPIVVLTPQQQGVYADMIRESNIEQDNQENIIALIAQSQDVETRVTHYRDHIDKLSIELSDMKKKFDEMYHATNQTIQNIKLEEAKKMNDFMMTFMMSVTKLEKGFMVRREEMNGMSPSPKIQDSGSVERGSMRSGTM